MEVIVKVEEEIQRLLALLKGADGVDIKIRKDGQDIWFEADWLERELLKAKS